MSKNTWYLKPVYVMVALALVLSLGVAALPVAQTAEASPGTDYYVSTAGNNTNDGLTWATAWRTITYAVETGCLAGNVSDPNIIHVAAGTYNTSGGENFTIDFDNPNVSLVGAGAVNTTIDGDGAGTILGINATGVTIQNFTVVNATYAIEANVGGFSLLDNVFSNDADHDIGTGVSVNIGDTNRSTDFSFDDVLIEGNEFYIDSEGVYLSLDVDFDDTATGLNATVGDVDILDNVFDMEATDGVEINIEVYDLTGGTVDIGDVDISDGNEFYGGYDGVYFDSYLNYFNSTAVTVGDFMVNGNIFEDQSDAAVNIEYYYYIDDWRGTTTGSFGDLEITGNNISSEETNSYGIYVDYYAYWEYFHNDASLTAGNVYIEDNDPIDVELDAIHFYYYYTEYLYDDAWITLGDLSIQGNNIDAGDDGMEVAYELGFYLYNNSALTVGDTYIVDNEVDAYYYGIYLGLWYIGYDMYDYATVAFGNITIERNDIYAELSEAIYVYGPYECGYYLYGHSAVTMGDINILDNNTGIVAENGNGVEIYYEYSGYDMDDDSMATFGDVNIEGNTIDAHQYGIYIYYYECASYMYGNATATWGDVRIVDNDHIDSATSDGVYIDYDYFGYYMDEYATASAGDVRIAGNAINASGSGHGILVYPYVVGCDLYDHSQVTMGELQIEGNVINATLEGIDIYWEYVACYLNGNASFLMGDTYIVDNQVASDDNGVYIYYYDYYVGSYMEDDSYARLPSYNITRNTFNVTGDGIYFRTYSNPDDNSGNATVDFGGFVIDDNNFSCDHGIYFHIEDFCETCMGDAVTTMGDVDITDNEFYGLDSEAIYISYIDLQYDPADNSALWVDVLTIARNLVDGASGGIKVEYDKIYGYDNSTTTMAGLNIWGNDLCNVTGDGIHVRYYLDADDTSTVTVGRALMQDNILDGSSDNGVYMGMVVESAPNATASVGDPVIEANTIENWQTGIYLEDVVNGTIIDNSIRYNGDGIYLDGSDNITILYNDILSNTGNASGVHLDCGCGEKMLVKCNNFKGNSPYGVYTAFATVNAANNWWGCSEGPGAAGCDTVIGNVTYDPWLPMEFWYCPVCGGTPPAPPAPRLQGCPPSTTGA